MRNRNVLTIAITLAALSLSSVSLSQWQAAGAEPTPSTIPASASYDACGSSCVRNPGNAFPPDGFQHQINNNCPTGCNWTKYHAGSSCQGQDLSKASCCRAWAVAMPYYYTHTFTCSQNMCDFSNSQWSESTTLVVTPTCAVQAVCPNCVV